MRTQRALQWVRHAVFGLLVAVEMALHAATLQDFGFQNMKVNGRLPLGQGRLLVTLIRVQGGFDFGPDHTRAYYDNLVFNLASTQSLSGYFLENSNGRFLWTRAGPGTIGPIDLPVPENYSNTAQRAGGDAGLTDRLYHSNLVARTMMSGLVDLRQFDADNNGVVTGDELHMLFVANEGQTGGTAARNPGRVQPPGFSYAVDIGSDAGVQFQTAFDTVAHEVTHTLGATDLYYPLPNCLNDGLTLMSCTSGNPDDRRTEHLDPWHKLQLGWCEPRIRSLRTGGVEMLHAAQMQRADGQVILYDPSQGTSEFFILEYRAPSSLNGSGYDRNVSGEGLVIWHVKQDGSHNPVPHPVSGVDVAVVAQGAPDLAYGGSVPWGSDVTTPYLRWFSGAATRTRIHVSPFNAGAGHITVEILAEEETWVDFSYTGIPELGTFVFPFNTLAEGLGSISYGGILRIKAGSTGETASFNKPMRVEAYGGNVTLGL